MSMNILLIRIVCKNVDDGSSEEPDNKEKKPLEGIEDNLNHANHASQEEVYTKYEQ